jgi:hypothetical protein
MLSKLLSVLPRIGTHVEVAYSAIRLTLALAVSLCLFAVDFAQASELSLKTAGPLKEAFIASVRNAILDDRSLAETLNLQFPGVNESTISDGLFAFESAILENFQNGWRVKEVEKLCADWGFSVDEAFDISLYYGLRIFDTKALDIEDPRVLFNRVKFISQQQLISENREEYERLRSRLTILSVPEIAVQMDMSEHQVYDKLGRYGLRISEAFNANGELDDLRKFHRQGKSFDEVAAYAKEKFGYGPLALRFIFHWGNDQEKIQEWTRVTSYEGELRTETEILVQLFDQGFSDREIANRLNALMPPNDRDAFRTESGVRHKLTNLGYRERQQNGREAYVPGYGFLYRNGRYVVPAMIKYCVDHRHEDNQVLADRLGLSEKSVQLFRDNNQLSTFTSDGKRSRLLRTMSRYDMQMLALERITDWMKDPSRGNGKTPNAVQLPGIAGFNGSSLLGFGVKTSKHDITVIFESSEDLFLQLKEYARDRGVNVSLLSLKFQSPPEEMKQALREETFEFIFDFQQKHGRLPTDKDTPFTFGNLKSNRGFFDSTLDLYKQYKDYARARGLEFFVSQAGIKGDDSEEHRAILKEECLEQITRWLKEHPGQSVIKEALEVTGLSPGRITGSTALFAPGGKYRSARIFDSFHDFYAQLIPYAKEQGVEVWFLDAKLAEMTPESRLAMQQEALELVAQWVQKHNGQMPTRVLTLRDPIPHVSFDRLAGTSGYQNGKEQEKSRIFDSPSDLYSAVEARLEVDCQTLLSTKNKSLIENQR